MFSSIAPLARHNPFYAPHFQLVQDGVRKRPAEPLEVPATRRGLAAASADEGESGPEGRRRRRGPGPWACGAGDACISPPTTRACAHQGGAGNVSAQRGSAGPGGALGLCACLEDEEGHGRGRRWQCFRSPGGVCWGAGGIRACRERTREGSSAE